MTTVRTSNLDTPAWRTWHDPDEPIRVGISSCLLGQKVRYDGGHKRDAYLMEVLGQWVTWVPVCPEVGIGLGIPRPSIRLEGTPEAARLVDPKSGRDLTETMIAYSERAVADLAADDLDGYVLKKDSPSCGMERVRVWGEAGQPDRRGVGVFARVLMDRWPLLPVEEEGRLNDPVLRENFIQRLFSRHRWRSAVRRGLTRARLVEFHTAHKLVLRAHTEAGYQRLGRLVASAGSLPDAELFGAYAEDFHTALRSRATTKRHANVLYHAAGYLKRVLDADGRRELTDLIEDYRNGLVPLVVPITLLRHHARRFGTDYLLGQLYLEPHPKELMLRNRV
jgi:uncharacterized protein YbgA (DUF1722 family)/uncharacterized protein YbbK (DUF523 family)